MPGDQVDLSKLKLRREAGTRSETFPKARYWLFLYVAAALFLLVGAFFFIQSLKTYEVDVTTVVLTSPSQSSTILTASGYVVAQQKAAIASKATGRLVYLGYQEGDRVKKGQVIARIESADVEAALEQARADLAVAQADSVDASRNLERSQALLQRQLIAQADFDAAQAEYDRTIATIHSRRANEEAAEVAVENTRIRAPFDGTILTKNADVGEVVAPFGAGASSKVAVVTIADMSSLEVEADVSEANIERVTVGEPCEVSLDAYPDILYRGVVDKIVPTADRAKATVLTKVSIINRDQRVLPEMSAKVHFLSKRIPDSVALKPKLTVDPSAIVNRNGQKVAFLIKGETVEEQDVQTGGMLGSLLEVTSGLSSGDRVVLRPPENLHHGDAVKVRQH